MNPSRFCSFEANRFAFLQEGLVAGDRASVMSGPADVRGHDSRADRRWRSCNRSVGAAVARASSPLRSRLEPRGWFRAWCSSRAGARQAPERVSLRQAPRGCTRSWWSHRAIDAASERRCPTCSRPRPPEGFTGTSHGISASLRLQAGDRRVQPVRGEVVIASAGEIAVIGGSPPRRSGRLPVRGSDGPDHFVEARVRPRDQPADTGHEGRDRRVSANRLERRSSGSGRRMHCS